MSASSIDTAAARATSRAWIRLGDDLASDQRTVELDLDALQLGTVQSTVVQRVAAASSELWVAAGFTELVVQRVESADRYGRSGTIDQRTVDVLMRQAGDGARVSQENACLAPWATTWFSSAFGDVAGSLRREVRSPFYVTGRSGAERGRSVLLRALADTADSSQIRGDEFELIELDNGNFLVVLAGVTDLSNPDLGLSDLNRTVRDIDRYAYPSAQSSSVADNRYAQLVRDGLVEAGVPAGARLMIVGHSFGADTALDLASDAAFTSRYDLTHVVAAGYNSRPQLADVDPDVAVLVLQNHRDVAVVVESAAHGHPTQAIEDAVDVGSSMLSFDVLGIAANQLSATYHTVGAMIDVVEHTVDHGDDLARAGLGASTGRFDVMVDELGNVVTLEPGIDEVGPRQLVDVFEGGGSGGGHHQRNYIDHVETVDDARVVGFFASLENAGFARSGTSWAVDVSVP